MVKQQDHKQSYDRDELDYHTKLSKPRFERPRKLRPIEVEAMMSNTDDLDNAYHSFEQIRIR